MPIIARYKNGNYAVTLYSNGTKIKQTANDYFSAEFPDSVDLKITDFCDMNCPMCHENSSVKGSHGDLSAQFLSTLERGTELAIGGGNPLSHPNLETFLMTMKRQGVICNLTVNERHFIDNADFLENLISERLIYGLGISINGCFQKTLQFAKTHKNVVLHLICGICDEEILEKLYDKNLKILFLGYKNFGRGERYHSKDVEFKIKWLKESIRHIAKRYNTVCFDNLALTQLDLKSQVPKKIFEERYMGDDGTASMYIDLVKREFAESSTSRDRYPITSDIRSMFAAVLSKHKTQTAT